MKTLSRLLLACSCLAPIPVRAGSPVPTAVFDFGFHDTSLQGEERGSNSAEQIRLHALNEQLRSLLAKSGCCTILPLGKVAEKTASIDMSNCNGCDADFAREIGARLAVTGSVQKVSNLILNINLSVLDVVSGRIVHAGSVDIRGNTDESWSRGLSYLLRDRLHPNQW
jgi:hypothetical protein